MTELNVGRIGLVFGVIVGGVIALSLWMARPEPQKKTPRKNPLVNYSVMPKKELKLSDFLSPVKKVLLDIALTQKQAGDFSGMLETIRSVEDDQVKIGIIVGLYKDTAWSIGIPREIPSGTGKSSGESGITNEKKTSTAENSSPTEATTISSGGAVSPTESVSTVENALTQLRQVVAEIVSRSSQKKDINLAVNDQSGLLHDAAIALTQIGQHYLTLGYLKEGTATLREAAAVAIQCQNMRDRASDLTLSKVPPRGKEAVDYPVWLGMTPAESKGSKPSDGPASPQTASPQYLLLWPFVLGAVGFVLAKVFEPVILAWSRGVFAKRVASAVGSSGMLKELDAGEAKDS